MTVKNLFSFLVGLGLLCPALSSAVDLTLTDSFSRTSGAFPIGTSISSDGNQAYLVYELSYDPTSPTAPAGSLIAEVFTNSDGTLNIYSTLATPNVGHPILSSIDDGAASPDFKLFSLVSDDQGAPNATSPATIQIQLFNRKFTRERAFNSFPDFAVGNPTASSGLGGEFSPDGKYVLMTYLTDATPGSLQSVLRVLRTSDLSEVASTPFTGGSVGSVFFKQGEKTYIATTSYDGTYLFDFDRDGAQPPSTLFVFELKGHSLKLIDTASLPQAAQTPTALTKDDTILIAVGTNRAVLAGEVTIFESDATKQSFLPRDGNEVRLYRFEKNRLKLINAQNPNLTSPASPFFSPCGKYAVVAEQAIDGSTGFFNIYTFTSCRDRYVFDRAAKTHATPPFFTGVFSDNSNWLLTTGSDQLLNQSDPDSNVNNVNLYKVQK